MELQDRQATTIAQINADLLSVLRQAKSVFGHQDFSFGDWEATCEALPAQLTEGIIRVAVVGPIKSGKSTFLNSLLGGDYLKRGAGVVTSIVTRVRSGDRLKAMLYFKSWNDVNADMEQALVLFPTAIRHAETGGFDIRQSAARTELRLALEALTSDQCISDDARNRNMVLLSCYLNGYDTAARFLEDPRGTLQYDHTRFIQHWDFAGNEVLAVYLKDILLSVNSGRIGSHIEIADCQGSDSSNPLHLAMIQEYLRLAHLLVYVISSRTGLRRADIKFLSMIKKMGILDNVLFVLNCDLDEHRSHEELVGLIERVSKELALIKPQPAVFTFSALYNLLRSQTARLAERDQRRLEQWRAETALVGFSDRETERFSGVFQEFLGHKRRSLLFQNPVERLNAIASGLAHWIGISRDILSRDADGARQTADRIRRHQQRFGQLLSALRSAVSGTVPQLKKELGAAVNRFLDAGSGAVVNRIGAFIDGYHFAPEAYSDNLDAAGFSQTLYQVFQEFKQALDGFITEQINPEIIRFTAEQETRIAEALGAIAEPYQGLIEDAYREFCQLIGELRLAEDCARPQAPAMPEIDRLLRHSGVCHPPLVSSMGYTARIRTEAILRLGFYRVLTGFKKVLKKPVTPGEEDRRALKDSMARIKAETRKSLGELLKDYQENLKFKYFFNQVDRAGQRLCEAVAQEIQAYATDFGALAAVASAKQEDKIQAAGMLEEMDRGCRGVTESIQQLKRSWS
jgi:GTPase SAR1 family protein